MLQRATGLQILWGTTILFFTMAASQGGLAQAFDVGPLYAAQPSNISQRCGIFNHKYQIDPNNPKVRIEWDGECRNGNADGPGMFTSYVGSQLANKQVVYLQAGKRQGKSTNLTWSIHGKPYHIVLESYKDGYVCGEGAEYDMQGKRYVAYEGDCRGGMKQTSNPLDYQMQYLGGPSWQMRLLYKFMFNMDNRNPRDAAEDVSQCIKIFTGGGFSRSVAESWCSLKW
jgi:hypothetical protein